MDCKPRRNTVTCAIPLYYWHEDPTAVYEEFFKDKQWQNYVGKRNLKIKIKERREVHLLTPFTAELFPQGIPESFILPSEVDIIFEVLDEMRGQPIKLYIHYTKPEAFLSTFRDIINKRSEYKYSILAHKAVCKSYLNENTDAHKEIEGIVEQRVKELSEFFAIEDVRAKIRTHLQKSCSSEEIISKCFRRECIGDLSRNSSEKYLLDDVYIGKKNDVKNKILSLIEMLSVEERLGADVKKIWNAYPPEICRKITHGLAQNIKNEQKALKLMQDTLGKGFVDRLMKRGYICFKGKDGNDYQIDIDGGVYYLPGKKYVCLMTEWNVPIFDEILAKYLFLKDASEEEIGGVIEDARDFQVLLDDNPEINYLEEYKARKNASYDIDLDGRIVDISLEEQGEKVS